MCDRIPPEKEAEYPNLIRSGYRKTSDEDPKYNCAAWSVGDTVQWYESSGENGMFWPVGVPKGFYLENYIRLFYHFGYRECDDAEVQAGYEKVALYSGPLGFFAHVAKQLPSGKWTSKLGPDEDIEHNSLDAFDGIGWSLARFMKRKLRR